MSIGSAIAALNPRNYWKLDETSGTVFADSGSSPRPLTGSGTLSGMGVAGPEQGTKALQVFSGFSAVTGAFGINGWSDYSNIFCITQPCTGAIPSQLFMGLSSLADQQGHGFWWRTAAGAAKTGFAQHTDRFGAVSVNFPYPEPLWHMYALTFNAASGNHTIYNEAGTLSTNVQTLPGFPPVTSDIWWMQSSNPMCLAHLAYFTRTLSAAEVTSIGAQFQQWPYGYPINMPPAGSGGSSAINPSDPVIVNINTDLSDIRAAVIRNYPKIT